MTGILSNLSNGIHLEEKCISTERWELGAGWQGYVEAVTESLNAHWAFIRQTSCEHMSDAWCGSKHALPSPPASYGLGGETHEGEELVLQCKKNGKCFIFCHKALQWCETANSRLATLPLHWVAEEFGLCTGCGVGLVRRSRSTRRCDGWNSKLCLPLLSSCVFKLGWPIWIGILVGMFSELSCQRAHDVAPQGPGLLPDGEQLLRAAFCMAAIWDNSTPNYLLTLNCLSWLCGPQHTFPWSLWCAQEPSSLSECTTWTSLHVPQKQVSPHAEKTFSRHFQKEILWCVCVCVCEREKERDGERKSWNSLTNEQGFLDEKFHIGISFIWACFTKLYSYDWISSGKTNPKEMGGVQMESLINYVGRGTPHTTFWGEFQEWVLASG